MNERIKQMAEQSGMDKILDDHAGEFGNGTFENTPYPALEKFAALAAEHKPLTDEVIADLWHANAGFHHHFARALERWLRGE